MHLPDPDILLILAAVLVVGVSLGALAKRFHLPSVTGQILAGVAISGLGIFPHDAADTLYPVTRFALGLMAVTIGAHLDFRKLRNARVRLLWLALMEATLVPAIVFLVLGPFREVEWSFGLMLGALAVSTAPATVIALVKETHAKGVFVNTLVAAVAINNMACIVLFEMARFVARDHVSTTSASVVELLLPALHQALSAASIGIAVAASVKLLSKLSHNPQWLATKGLIAILLTLGLARYTGASPLLACLFLGLGQANLSRHREHVVDVPFAHFMPVILAAFFTIAGMELTLQYAWRAGPVALAFVVARMVGKLLAARFAMRLGAATEPLQKHLGSALIPQAGVAVGLVVLLEEDPILQAHSAQAVEWFAAAVLTSVVGNEIIGPIMTRLALRKSGEAGADRTRLFDFVQEHNIVTNLTANDMQDAIRQLGDVLARSHGLSAKARDALVKSALEREEHTSTCLGEGLAIPHGNLENGSNVIGVMGLSAEGLPFDTPDGRPVHCMVMLATPDTQRERHLEILAALARTVGSNASMQDLLFNAKTPAHAYDILTGEHAGDLNYFLDDMESRKGPGRRPRRGHALRG